MAAAAPEPLLAASVAVELHCIAAASVPQTRVCHGLPCRLNMTNSMLQRVQAGTALLTMHASQGSHATAVGYP